MRILLFVSALAAVSGSAPAASLLTLTNPVADGAINTAAGNNVRSDWNTTTPFPADADEANVTDFNQITVAHDSANFYLRQEMFRTSSGFFTNEQKVLIDTDQSSATGYAGPAGNYAIGAEFLLEGPSLFSFTGGATQTSFSWSFVGTVSFDDFPTNDHEMTISRADLGNPVSFDLIALTDYFGGGDNYPDTAVGGGGYYTYTIIPEPSAAALLGVTGLLVLFRRRR